LVAPELEGKYCAFFRFVHGDNSRFGQKVWCDIMVTKPRGEFNFISEPRILENNLIEREEAKEEHQEVSSLLNESE